MSKTIEVATFGGGCFWCIDAAFRRVEGVINVSSGYTGGETDNPTYEQICTGLSGHAEVVQLEFDANQISYNTLLEMFFTLHEKQIREQIVTEVSTASHFYSAEQYHQDYYNENPNQGYCSILIAPKLKKFEQLYADKLK